MLPQASKQIILDTNLKLSINSYLASLERNPQSLMDLQDLIKFIKANKQEGYPQRDVEGFKRAQATDQHAKLYKDMLAKDVNFTSEGGI